MSRRPPGPDKSEQNRATLKQLVKLESNKSCADCKRNKHPRWASWNIGVFVCIRCSGIHRGMGTHVSRVKSVDLDSWTDEQLQSMIKWGNARANKYWEHKLAEGHVPNEAKIENFIRTKYDSRRWVMDGPMPDPSTLDGASADDDDVPLNVVQEKARERAASVRNGSAGGAAIPQPPRPRAQMNLFDDEPTQQPVRPSTTEPAVNRSSQPKAPVAPPKQTKPGESLLGLDFFGGTQSAPPARPSSTGPSTGGVPGRSDLKQSILSLYASKPAAPPQQPAASAFGGFQSPMQSPPLTSPTQSNAQALGGLGDAFGSLSMTQPSQPKPVPFQNFTAPAGHSRQSSASKPALSGGSFFDAKPAPPPKVMSPPSQPVRQPSSGFGDFGDFSSAASPPPPVKSPPAASSTMGDLFDMPLSAPQTKQTVAAAPMSPPLQSPAAPSYSTSAFNLSQPTPAPPKPAAPAQTASSNFSSLNNMDAWGSNDAWATPDPPAAAQAAKPVVQQAATSSFKSTPAPAATSSQNTFDSGWGDPVQPAKPTPPQATTTSSAGGFSVQQDEEFGGWSHASPVATTTGPKQGGLGGNSDDLFGNVWE